MLHSIEIRVVFNTVDIMKDQIIGLMYHKKTFKSFHITFSKMKQSSIPRIKKKKKKSLDISE